MNMNFHVSDRFFGIVLSFEHFDILKQVHRRHFLVG